MDADGKSSSASICVYQRLITAPLDEPIAEFGKPGDAQQALALVLAASEQLAGADVADQLFEPGQRGAFAILDGQGIGVGEGESAGLRRGRGGTTGDPAEDPPVGQRRPPPHPPATPGLAPPPFPLPPPPPTPPPHPPRDP